MRKGKSTRAWKWYHWLALYPVMVVATGIGILVARWLFGKTLHFPEDIPLVLFTGAGGLVGGIIGSRFHRRGDSA
jgi:uncharacterized membrane protein YfcA